MWSMDKYVNRVVPAPRFHRWSAWIPRWLGYRTESQKDSAKALHELVVDFWILVASFAGMVAIMVTFKYGAPFQHMNVPPIVPSWAASAVLLFNAVESPLAQPRNCFFGTMISSIIGVCLVKLFMTNDDNLEYIWLCGALAVGISSVVMRLTNCIHPPAGAAALIPALSKEFRVLGWYYLLVQLLSSVLIVAVACIFNNIQRRYPLYWWTPIELMKPKESDEEDKKPPLEEEAYGESPSQKTHEISIGGDHWHVPEGVDISAEEERILLGLQLQLQGLDSGEAPNRVHRVQSTVSSRARRESHH